MHHPISSTQPQFERRGTDWLLAHRLDMLMYLQKKEQHVGYSGYCILFSEMFSTVRGRNGNLPL